jgi:DNA-binding NarL/FixJ family response regulator
MHADPNIAASAFEAGAAGYLIKDSSVDELPKAVQQVRSGHRYLDGRIDLRGALPLAQAERNALSSLTPRQKQVLALVARRQPYPAIANELGMTEKAIVCLMSRVKRKLGIRGLANMIRHPSDLKAGIPRSRPIGARRKRAVGIGL